MKAFGVLMFCLLAATYVFSHQIILAIDKELKDAEEVKEPKANVTFDCNCFKGVIVRCQVTATVFSPELENAVVRIFFANSEKNVLETSFVANKLIGMKYEKPHVLEEELGMVEIVKTNGTRTAIIPESWMPANATRISAAVIGDKIYNYYGIFNAELSYPDLMVVENFMRLRFFGERLVN